MDAYIYKADLWCTKCITKIKQELTTPDNPDDETTFDSDDYPKGPYPDGGGEADSPNHCAECALFLENPLTDDGREYVREAVSQHRHDRYIKGTIKLWSDFYEIN